MNTLLQILCSPRGDVSGSRQVAEHFTQNLVKKKPGEWRVDILNLWEQALPEMDLVASSAKYAVMSGSPLTEMEQQRWHEIEQHFRRFRNADTVVIALPMWNFGIPYVLKHYIDIITQPGLAFKWDATAGYVPLVEAKRCVLVNSSAADYQPGNGLEDKDFCVPYLQKWLKVYFGYQVDSLIFAPTVQTDDQVEIAKKSAFDQANALIGSFH